jgi:hypothetical protein
VVIIKTLAHAIADDGFIGAPLVNAVLEYGRQVFLTS